MKYQNTITTLVTMIVIFSSIAAITGLFSSAGPGPYQHESIRGEMVDIYGKGIYKHMSADVAPQGIAHDVVTFFLAIPMLIYSLYMTRSGSLQGRFLLAGTLAYFLVTYLFYLIMAMYNVLFPVYVLLLGCSFFAFSLVMLSIDLGKLPQRFSKTTPVRFAGGFLIFNSIMIGFLWLSIIIPPLLDGTIIPVQVEHYTTLIVQGVDLAILLPLSFIAGLLIIKKQRIGYLLSVVYYIFLTLLMTALTAKIIAMGLLGQSIIPVVFIIPAILIITIYLAVTLLRSVHRVVPE